MGRERNDMGWGLVAENSILGKEDNILVFLQEQFPNAEGKLETTPATIYTDGVDQEGKKYQMKIETNSTITATYLKRDPNRVTAPQVQKGERVMVYRFDGDQTFYWEPLNIDQNKRVQETIVHSCAAKPKEAGKEPTPNSPENCYSITQDGVNGMVEIRMTAANGEMSPWLLQFNGKNGKMVLTDQKGNLIQIDTENTVIDVCNTLQSHVQLDKQVINMYCADTLNILAENEINVKTTTLNIECQTYNHKADQVKWDIGNNINMNVGSGTTISCPSITLDGNVLITGNLSVGGGGRAAGGSGGNAKIAGDIRITGTSSATDHLSSGTSGHNHIHGESHGNTTPPL